MANLNRRLMLPSELMNCTCSSDADMPAFAAIALIIKVTYVARTEDRPGNG
jgi:hypothetical protein